MKNNQLTLVNEMFGEVRTIVEKDDVLFVATDVARALGYTNPQKAVRDHTKRSTERDVQHPQSPSKTMTVKVIGEGDLYRLIARSKLEKAEQFEDWVFEEVLPSIRKNGAYISEDITEEQENKLDRFGTTRKLASTILNTSTINLLSLKDEYIEYKKPRNGTEKMRYLQHVLNAIDNKIEVLNEQRMIGEVHDLQNVARVLQDEKLKLSNRKNGGEKAALKREVRQLEKDIQDLQGEYTMALVELGKYDLDNLKWNTINYHPFTVNYMYKRVGKRVYKTPEYEGWIRKFPYKDLPLELNVDTKKPFEILVRYEAKQGFDIDNCLKSFIDYLQNYYGFNDNMIHSIHAERVSTVKAYSEGKISFVIRQSNVTPKAA